MEINITICQVKFLPVNKSALQACMSKVISSANFGIHHLCTLLLSSEQQDQWIYLKNNLTINLTNKAQVYLFYQTP